jgi:hypothetical protein
VAELEWNLVLYDAKVIHWPASFFPLKRKGKKIFLLAILIVNWTWWHTPVIPAPRRLKQEDLELEASLATYRDTLLKQKKSMILDL